MEAPACWRLRWYLGLLTVASAVLFRQVFLHPDEMLLGNDIVRLHSTFKAVQYRSWWEYGQFPLWDPTILCGRSVVGDPLHAVLNPLSWIFWCSASPMLFGLYLWTYTTLGAYGMCLFMRRLGAAPAGALVAAVAFAFSGKAAGYVFAGHMETLPTMMGAPWVFWGAERLLQLRTLRSAVVLGGVLCITATAGHLPSFYWHILFAGGYVAIRLFLLGIQGDWGAVRARVLLFLATGVVFVLGGMAWWLPVLRQTLLSARTGSARGSFAFSTMLSAAPSDLARMLWPFNGMPLPDPSISDPENGFFWETASYPGLVAVALAVLLVVAAPRDTRTRIFGALAVVAVLLALGSHTPVYWLAYEVIPGLSLQRVPGRLFWYSNFFIACMAGLGMSDLLTGGARVRQRFVIVVAVLLLASLCGMPALAPDSGNPAGGFVLALIVASALFLMAALVTSQRLGPRALAVLIVVLSVLDLGTVWAVHVYTAAPATAIPSNSVADFLRARQAEEGPFRYFDPTESIPQQLAGRIGLESITGYHPGISQQQLETYHALWGPRDTSSVVQLLMHSPKDVACTPLLDLMNVRYVVAWETELDGRFRKVFTTAAGDLAHPCSVFERMDPLPRCFVVPSAEAVDTSAAALEAQYRLLPREACIMEGPQVAGAAAFQSVAPTSSVPGKMQFVLETEAAGVLIVSEGWHPDWVAMDNGRSLSVYRAADGFLGIPLASGQHDVRVRYRPWDFFVGCGIAAGFWLSLGVAWVLRAVNRRRAGASRTRPQQMASTGGQPAD